MSAINNLLALVQTGKPFQNGFVYKNMSTPSGFDQLLMSKNTSDIAAESENIASTSWEEKPPFVPTNSGSGELLLSDFAKLDWDSLQPKTMIQLSNGWRLTVDPDGTSYGLSYREEGKPSFQTNHFNKSNLDDFIRKSSTQLKPQDVLEAFGDHDKAGKLGWYIQWMPGTTQEQIDAYIALVNGRGGA